MTGVKIFIFNFNIQFSLKNESLTGYFLLNTG